MQVGVIQNRRDLEALLPKWVRLFASDPRATARCEPHLICAFHRMFTPEIRPRVLVAKDQHDVVRGVLPLGLRLHRIGPVFVRHLGPLIDWHAYFTDAIVDPDFGEEVCAALRKALIALPWEELAIRRVRRESWLLDPEFGVMTRLDGVRKAEGDPACRISLPARATLQRKDLAELRRRERALLDSGEVVTGWETVGPHLLATIHEFVRLHSQLKAFQGQTQTFTLGTANRDFPEWLAAEITAGRAGLFITRRDGQLLAASIVFRSHRTSHSYRTAWAPEAAALGLGTHQTALLLEACSERGDSVYDLGPGSEPHKLKWHPEVPVLVDLTVSRDGWRSTLAAAWLRLRRKYN